MTNHNQCLKVFTYLLNSIVEKATGAGWGNIRSRVDYLKGKLDIQSEPGQGTSVHIIIPVS